jgi:hypothetical protein
MQKARAALGSLIFLVIAPGVVAGLIPWWLKVGPRKSRYAVGCSFARLGGCSFAWGLSS